MCSSTGGSIIMHHFSLSDHILNHHGDTEFCTVHVLVSVCACERKKSGYCSFHEITFSWFVD